MTANSTSFKPGEGRKKGALSKNRSPAALVREFVGKVPGYNPVYEMWKLLEQSEDETFHIQVHREISKYMIAPLKPVTAPISETIPINATDSPKQVANTIMQMIATGSLSLDQGGLLLQSLASVNAIESGQERELLLSMIKDLDGLSADTKQKALELSTPAPESTLNFL